jgi:hypothetical protein
MLACARRACAAPRGARAQQQRKLVTGLSPAAAGHHRIGTRDVAAAVAHRRRAATATGVDANAPLTAPSAAAPAPVHRNPLGRLAVLFVAAAAVVACALLMSPETALAAGKQAAAAAADEPVLSRESRFFFPLSKRPPLNPSR